MMKYIYDKIKKLPQFRMEAIATLNTQTNQTYFYQEAINKSQF